MNNCLIEMISFIYEQMFEDAASLLKNTLRVNHFF